MHRTLVFVFACSCLLTACSKQQKVIFEAQSVSYPSRLSSFSDKIQKACANKSEELKAYLDAGWRVVTSNSKEPFVEVPDADYIKDAKCVGTEYIIEK